MPRFCEAFCRAVKPLCRKEDREMMNGTMTAIFIVLAMAFVVIYGIVSDYFSERVGHAAVFAGFIVLATGFMYDVIKAVATATDMFMMSMF